MDRTELKSKAVKLRRKGKTFSEITKILKISIPKSTLSGWCHNVPLPLGYRKRIEDLNRFNLNKARKIALAVKKAKRDDHLQSIANRNRHLSGMLKNRDVGKIALSVLFLGEGFKDPKRGSLAFGNSNPFIISFFLNTLRYCYDIDESKFRCTLQCRADQDIKKLEKFWSRVTDIPPSQFYKARVDPRTIGKPSKKLDYKGVCRIDYFSADIFIELLQIPKIIYKGP